MSPEELNELLKMFNLPENFTVSQLKQAYRDLSLIWHPDRLSKNPRLSERADNEMKKVNAAYKKLKLHLESEAEKNQKEGESDKRQHKKNQNNKNEPAPTSKDKNTKSPLKKEDSFPLPLIISLCIFFILCIIVRFLQNNL